MTELRVETYEIPAADLGPENPLPVFRDPNVDHQITLDPNVPEEDRRYLGWQIGHRVLPHRMQDGYNRNKQLRKFNALILENEYLRATVLPELGGRLVSLIHKPQNRELLDRNPVFQPANLALRNAWFSGGIEWNTCHFGHYYLTCSPVFAAKLTDDHGNPFIRLYEWDRVKGFPWQVDLHLPSGSEFLYAHARLINPHDYEMPMYWWTNMAVPEKPDVRVIVPADSSIHNAEDGMALMHMPYLDDTDISYTTNAKYSKEYFFRITKDQRRWIAAIDGQGSGFIQTSTARLKGRKLFCWGTGSGGQRWQEYLSAPGQAYLEIQAGLAQTQIETIPMPANTHWTWTEAYGLLETDPGKAHSKDWNTAKGEVETVLESQLPRLHLDILDREFAELSLKLPEEIVSAGSGWGALERRRLAVQGEEDCVPRELVFDESTLGPDQEPWSKLLVEGMLPDRNPQEDPGQPMVQDEWRSLLEQAIFSGKSDHWLAWLHLGNMRIEALDTNGARQAWEKSLELNPSGWALRNLSILETRAGNKETALDLLRKAWETGPQIAPLAVEYAQLLLQMERYEELRNFVQSLPEDIKQNERIALLSGKATLETGNLDEIEPLFTREFATIREGEVTLTDLWFTLHERRIAAAENVPVDDDLRRRVRRDFPPPANIDFRMLASV